MINTENEHVLGYVRYNMEQRVLIYANFSEKEQMIPGNLLRLHNWGSKLTDAINGTTIPLGDIILEPYQFLCLMTDPSKS